VSGTFQEEVAPMVGPEAMPRSNGEFVFEAPWQGRAVAVAVALVDRLGVSWDDFRQHLIAAIDREPDRSYYDSWAVALEAFVTARGLADNALLTAATPTERLAL
jgi:nitrile hydratase accessory protein